MSTSFQKYLSLRHPGKSVRAHGQSTYDYNDNNHPNLSVYFKSMSKTSRKSRQASDTETLCIAVATCEHATCSARFSIRWVAVEELKAKHKIMTIIGLHIPAWSI